MGGVSIARNVHFVNFLRLRRAIVFLREITSILNYSSVVSWTAVGLNINKKTPTRLDPWEIRDWRLAYWFLNIYNESAFSYFLFFLISCPFLFLISVFWFSCLGSSRVPRNALGPTALGDGGVLSGFLFYIRNPFKINLEQKSSPRNSTHLQFYIGNPFNFFSIPFGG